MRRSPILLENIFLCNLRNGVISAYHIVHICIDNVYYKKKQTNRSFICKPMLILGMSLLNSLATLI
ncbi:hypothetical protein C0J52_18679 [Blattella germanica]|nr:hypothetical protein C0J52_18679 [Blattella germanica]